MLFLSPAVLTTESDQTLYTAQVANKVGAIAGAFQWGPVDAPYQITNGEKEFVSVFGIPDNATYKYVMPLLDFFAYSNVAWVVRQVGANAKNAFPTGQTAELIKNDDAFASTSIVGSDFIAKYPGSAGNGLEVVIIDQAHFSGHELFGYFTYAPTAGEYNIAVVDSTGYWTGTPAKKQKENLYVNGTVTALPAPVVNAPTTSTTGGTLAAGTYYYKVTALGAVGETIGSSEVSVVTTGTTSSNTLTWAAISGATGYRVYRGTAAGAESVYLAAGNATTFTDTGAAGTAGTVPVSNTAVGTFSVYGVPVSVALGDSASTVASKIAATAGFIALFSSVTVSGPVVTYVENNVGYSPTTTAPAAQNGLTFVTSTVDPGSLGGVLEKYNLMTMGPTDRFADGTVQYFADAINQQSKYIRVADKTIPLSYRTTTLSGGVDDQTVNVTSGFQQYANKEAYDIQFLIAPDVSDAEKIAIIDLAESRGDCMPFIAPPMVNVVNNRGNEANDIKNWRLNQLVRDSNYAFMVDNWGYMYDKYNQVYRWVPATGGTAGIFARTFVNNDPWISPAGLTRGKYLNYNKMAWSASEDDRDLLYPVGINSIVTFPAQGIVLFGDKTLTQKPSAFSRVNVRWAFIVAEESVSAMAQYFLFEINDSITRAQFVNAVTPFLRNMKNRRAFEDFRVVCDETNNDPDTILQNKFMVQLLLKPTYSINWVVLNLTAVRPDVSFTVNA
jgi:hypothetical protein